MTELVVVNIRGAKIYTKESIDKINAIIKKSRKKKTPSEVIKKCRVTEIELTAKQKYEYAKLGQAKTKGLKSKELTKHLKVYAEFWGIKKATKNRTAEMPEVREAYEQVTNFATIGVSL